MSKTPSRRLILKGAATLSIVGCSALSSKSTADVGCVSELQPLWLRRRDLISRSCELDRIWLERRSQLPEWCLPGPKYLDSDGNRIGSVVGWPETCGDLIADGDKWLLRPSPKDFRRLYNSEAGVHAASACARYLDRMRLLRRRLRERRVLIAKVGLPITSDWKILDTEIELVERTIFSLPACPDTDAARLTMTLRNRRIKSATEDQSELGLLKASIHAYLSGETPNLSGFILESILHDLEILDRGGSI